MDGMINFLEIIGNEYKLCAENLNSALEKANDCNSIAIISIIGPENNGKTFFIDCLFNYMKSKYKDEWPACHNAIININKSQNKQNNEKNKVLKISSQPFIIKEKPIDKVYKTAIYLIDSENIFDLKIQSIEARDMSALLILTSSTVIYNIKHELPVYKPI
jgi:hypothetical protein